MGHEVYVVQAIPYIIHPSAFGTQWTAGSCPLFRVLREDCGVETTLSEAAVRQGEVWSATELIVEETESRLIDFSKTLCPNETCETFRNGNWAYWDANHLTSLGSSSLAQTLAREIS